MGHVTEQSAMITQLIIASAAFANMISVALLWLEDNVKLNFFYIYFFLFSYLLKFY